MNETEEERFSGSPEGHPEPSIPTDTEQSMMKDTSSLMVSPIGMRAKEGSKSFSKEM